MLLMFVAEENFVLENAVCIITRYSNGNVTNRKPMLSEALNVCLESIGIVRTSPHNSEYRQVHLAYEDGACRTTLIAGSELCCSPWLATLVAQRIC